MAKNFFGRLKTVSGLDKYRTDNTRDEFTYVANLITLLARQETTVLSNNASGLTFRSAQYKIVFNFFTRKITLEVYREDEILDILTLVRNRKVDGNSERVVRILSGYL